jgi:hypothetical protein
MSEDIEHPATATSPIDVFLHRRPDDQPQRCARQAMPELGYGRWRRMCGCHRCAMMAVTAEVNGHAQGAAGPRDLIRALAQAVVALGLHASGQMRK